MSGSDRRTDVDGAAEAYLEVLDHHGVEYFFNSPGSEDSPFWEAFAKQAAAESPDSRSITHVNCRHESVAVTMAKGYAMVTGRPQAVKLHVNVGPLHAAMEMYGADHSSVPMLVLGSYNSTHEGELPGGTSGPHYLNYQQPGGHENNFARYVKWVGDLKTNANAERVFDRALRVAESWPPGPAVLNISQELLYDEGKQTVDLVRNSPADPPAPGPDVLDDVAARLEAASNPLIITGRLGRNPGAVDALVELAERLQIPVFENQKWHHNFPTDHPLYVGASSGTAATPDAYFEEDVDLVFVVDSSKPWYPPEGGAPDADVVFLNPDPVQENKAYWNYPADVLVDGDSSRVLPALLDRVSAFEGTRPTDWRRAHEKWDARWTEKALAGREEKPIDPFWLCHVLDDALPDDAIVCNETILHGSVVANLVRDGSDRRYLEASRSAAGGLGTGIGLTLGAKLAAPDRPAVLLIGDGSYHYNPVTASYAAAHELGLPLLTVLFNNGGYQSMKANLVGDFEEGWAERTESYPGSPITPTPDYAEEMDVWGGVGESVADPADLEPAIERGLDAISEGNLALVDVHLDQSPPDIPPIEL